MKTSNKLLLGALTVIIIGMIAVNIALKQEIDQLPKNKDIEIIKENTDSINSDSVSININL